MLELHVGDLKRRARIGLQRAVGAEAQLAGGAVAELDAVAVRFFGPAEPACAALCRDPSGAPVKEALTFDPYSTTTSTGGTGSTVAVGDMNMDSEPLPVLDTGTVALRPPIRNPFRPPIRSPFTPRPQGGGAPTYQPPVN